MKIVRIKEYDKELKLYFLLKNTFMYLCYLCIYELTGPNSKKETLSLKQ